MDAPLTSASNNVAGVKRSAPSLLPAFEPSSTPPRFKRQKSRVSATEHENHYPTPIPSSSLGILPSPPPAVPRRPLLQRTQSTVSERAPLAAVPSITLPENGEPVLMGRSSNSSHYRLSANRLISRVHVKAAYTGTSSDNSVSKPKVEITCLGWNGVKVHCQGHAWELGKGDVFKSETEGAEIMLDVQDSRVLLMWPAPPSSTVHSSTDTIFDGPQDARASRSPSIGLPVENDENEDPRRSRRAGNASFEKFSPVSPTPKRGISGNALILPSESQVTTDTFLEIYEDEPVPELPSSEDADWREDTALCRATARDISIDFNFAALDDKDAEEVGLSYHAEPDLPRPMKAFGVPSSLRSTPPPPPSSPPPVDSRPHRQHRFTSSISPQKVETVQNYITNQLAFSRIATTPLTELYENLPSALAATITREKLVDVLAEIECIGEVKRHGKDAAGKPLESQYYYMPEKDDDEGRRAAVGGRAGLRNCRKTHKVSKPYVDLRKEMALRREANMSPQQYFWKKPKKPT